MSKGRKFTLTGFHNVVGLIKGHQSCGRRKASTTEAATAWVSVHFVGGGTKCPHSSMGVGFPRPSNPNSAISVKFNDFVHGSPFGRRGGRGGGREDMVALTAITYL